MTNFFKGILYIYSVTVKPPVPIRKGQDLVYARQLVYHVLVIVAVVKRKLVKIR